MEQLLLEARTKPQDHTESLVNMTFWVLNQHQHQAREMLQFMRKLVLENACSSEGLGGCSLRQYDRMLCDLEDLFFSFREEKIYNVIQGLA